jgi:hypothetical protein
VNARAEAVLIPGARVLWLRGRHRLIESRLTAVGERAVEFVNVTRRRHLRGPWRASREYLELHATVLRGGREKGGAIED